MPILPRLGKNTASHPAQGILLDPQRAKLPPENPAEITLHPNPLDHEILQRLPPLQRPLPRSPTQRWRIHHLDKTILHPTSPTIRRPGHRRKRTTTPIRPNQRTIPQRRTQLRPHRPILPTHHPRTCPAPHRRRPKRSLSPHRNSRPTSTHQKTKMVGPLPLEIISG